jgi:predicted O-methyltransferase YrrM
MKKDSIPDSKSLNEQVMKMLESYDVEAIMPDMQLVGDGQKNEVRDVNGRPNKYYQWLSCLTRLLKPKQVVELGAAAGISTTMIASELSPDAKFYSVDIDPTIAWKWMSKDFPQVTKILGDDLNMAIWPGSVDLGKTDLWFIDSLHTYEQIKSEIDLYKSYFKRDAVVVLDDIHLLEMGTIWEELKYDKCDNTDPCHYSGFGFFVV